MLTIALMGKTQEFFEYYTKNRIEKSLFVVTPSPEIADRVRKRFEQLGRSTESLTISKFMKDELSQVLPKKTLANYKGKSELILLLGAIWKKIGREQDYISFKQAFNLLTEFRSFSVSDQVLETVLENYEEELSVGVMWLQRFLSELELIDEHKSYFLLSEKLRGGGLPSEYEREREIVFYGFDFLTASQVDMLKALSIENNITLPFYKEAFEKASHLDWVHWLNEENQTNLLHLGEIQQASKDQKLYRFPRNYLSKLLQSLPVIEDKMDLVLGTKKMTREHVQEVPFSHSKLKVLVDIFEEDYYLVSAMVESFIGENEVLSLELRAIIQEKAEELIKRGEYRALKVCFLYLKKINEWEELSDENSSLKFFDFSIIKESLKLDLPRVNISNIDKDSLLEVNSLNEMEEIKGKKIAFSFNSNHGGIRSVDSNFTENVEKYLSSIGPIRRSTLDMDVLKCQLKEFVIDNDVVFLIEEGLIEEDAKNSDFFSEINLKTQSHTIEFEKSKHYFETQVQTSKLERISASRLQSYMECPRKFYLSYIEKNFPQVELLSELSALEMGRIEHKVIEKYFEVKNIFDEDFLDNLIKEILHATSKKIEDFSKYFIEVKSYTLNTIKYLLAFKENHQLELSFELPFNEREEGILFNGSIDLFGQGRDLRIVFDFKRSNRSFSTFSSILEFNQIQLWFYLARLEKMSLIDDAKPLVVAYIDLSNLENSIFLCDNKELGKTMKNDFPWSKVKFIDDFPSLVGKYSEFEGKIIQKLDNDSELLPLPKNKNSCDFCPIKNTCPRE